MPRLTQAARVLLAIPKMESGGSQRVMLNLLRNMDRSRFEPHLAVLNREGPHIKEVPPDIPVHDLGVSSARFAVMPLAKLCWQIRPQAILSMLAYMNTAVIAARSFLPKPIRLLVREGTRTASRQVTSNRLRFWIYKEMYRRANIIVCQSEFMKQEMLREFGLAEEQLARIYNPVDIDLISELARREGSPFPTSGPNLVAVGRLSREKGLDLLLHSMTLVRAAVPRAQLTIVGQGPLEAELKNQTRQLALESCVHLVGFQENPYRFLSRADLLVIASRYEGLPNAALEALALGTFVAATDCTGALPEIAIATSRIRIAPERTPECLAATILDALGAAREAQKRSDPEPEFIARFGLKATIAQYEELLDGPRAEPVSLPERSKLAS